MRYPHKPSRPRSNAGPATMGKRPHQRICHNVQAHLRKHGAVYLRRPHVVIGHLDVLKRNLFGSRTPQLTIAFSVSRLLGGASSAHGVERGNDISGQPLATPRAITYSSEQDEESLALVRHSPCPDRYRVTAPKPGTVVVVFV